MEIRLNGTLVELDVDPDMPLLWAIRESAGLTGTKFGCGIGACGACTVHVDGVAMRACLLPVGMLAGRSVTTIEGITAAGGAADIQAEWVARQVPQCGYCQSGMVMAVSALLAANAAPSDADIDAAITNICRCGTYERIRQAIHAVVEGRANAVAARAADTPEGEVADG